MKFHSKEFGFTSDCTNRFNIVNQLPPNNNCTYEKVKGNLGL